MLISYTRVKNKLFIQTNCNLRSNFLNHNEVVISVDVTSLYTNVPVKEGIFEAAEKLYSGKVALPPLDNKTFIILIELATTNVLMLTHDGLISKLMG